MTNWIGFFTLVEREIYRFTKLMRQTVLPPIMMTFLYVLIFGYSIGPTIQQIHHVSYIEYILPGLVMMGVITSAYANTSTSLYMARMELFIQDILISPLSYVQVVAAFILGGIIRGAAVGSIILGMAVLLTPLSFTIYTVGFCLVFIILVSSVFSCLGIMAGLWSETWDHVATFTNFIMMPLIFLGGVFYSVDMLPPFWRTLSLVNPIVYMVSGIRYACMGISDVGIGLSLCVVVALAVTSFLICLWLFKIGYKLVS